MCGIEKSAVAGEATGTDLSVCDHLNLFVLFMVLTQYQDGLSCDAHPPLLPTHTPLGSVSALIPRE